VPPRRTLILLAATTAVVALIVSRSWIVDDSYITLRMIDNAVNGYGLRWNAAERVQAFTHPLWALCLFVAYWITREAYFTSVLLSLATSAFAIYVIGFRLSRDWVATVLALGVLALSRAFIDFSAGNLENPLAHALIALFSVSYFRGADPEADASPRVTGLSVIAGLLVLVRTDLAVLVLPALVVRLWSHRAHAWRALIIGFAPVAVWTMISIVYYGFPFPNTAYAKLAHGISSSEQFIQGLSYLLESAVMDPITLVATLVAVIIAIRGRRRAAWPVGTGILLYLAYVVRVGGDYMSGRFLAAPFLLSVLFLLMHPMGDRFRRRALAVLVVAGAVALGSRFVIPPVTRVAFLRAHFADDDPKWNRRRARATYRYIIDQRGDDNPTSLYNVWKRPNHELAHEWINLGRRLAARPPHPFVYGAVGLLGFYAGPAIHIVDAAALGDPLLARLPATRPYFVGHYDRRMPPGYYETLDTGTNVIQDPNLRAYYDDLQLVTRGPIWSMARFKAILRLNLGSRDSLLKDYGAIDVDAEERDGACWYSSEAGAEIWERGLRLHMAQPCKGRRVAVMVTGPARYSLEYSSGGRTLATQFIDIPDNEKQAVFAPVALDPGVSFDRVDFLLANDALPSTVFLLRFTN